MKMKRRPVGILMSLMAAVAMILVISFVMVLVNLDALVKKRTRLNRMPIFLNQMPRPGK